MGIQKAVGDRLHSPWVEDDSPHQQPQGPATPRSHTTHFLPLPSPPHHSLSLTKPVYNCYRDPCAWEGVGERTPYRPHNSPHKLFTWGRGEEPETKAGSAGAARRLRVPRVSAGYKELNEATRAGAGRVDWGQWARSTAAGAPQMKQSERPGFARFYSAKRCSLGVGGRTASPETTALLNTRGSPNSRMTPTPP